MNIIYYENPPDLREGKPKKKRSRYPTACLCAAFLGPAVVLVMTACAYIVGVLFDNPVPRDGPSKNELLTYDFPFVTRAQWHARPPKQTDKLTTPVPYVVIHHSYTPGACYTNEQCSQAMRSMQNYHMDDHGWWDIGYNFGVGGNGTAYEGRGWKTIGAHAKYFVSVSIGICLIGDWRFELPPDEQMKTAHMLIEAGVSLGFISPDYKLVGHRQVRATECPGDALFKEIKTWPNFSPFPNSVDDLVNVKELSPSVREQLQNMSVNGTETINVPALLHKLGN